MKIRLLRVRQIFIINKRNFVIEKNKNFIFRQEFRFTYSQISKEQLFVQVNENNLLKSFLFYFL